MIKKSGQTALILILLSAAALIFLAVALNWGRVAQSKLLLSIGAYESTAMLTSDAASFGEMQKQQYLNDKNSLTEPAAWIMAIIAFLLVLVTVVIDLLTGQVIKLGLAIAALVMLTVNLVLQLTVVSPMTTMLWNKAQKNQPMAQQFFEQGISTALQSTVTDQVNITDYFDANANGAFGNNSYGFPNDTIGRFAFLYGERTKMLAQPLISQVVNYYNNLGEFLNGSPPVTSSQAYSCPPYGNSTIGCNTYPLQLNDVCPPADANPNLPNGQPNPAYNPYCDPCCQLSQVPDPFYNQSAPNPFHPNPFKTIRPTSCPADLTANINGNSVDLGAPSECWINNPYNSTPTSTDSPYPLLYDPVYQNFANSSSLLDMFGRDEQEDPVYNIGGYPYMTPMGGAFPDGIFPFFWLTKDYSLEVDNISPSVGPGNTGPSVPASQMHWCAANGIDGVPDIALSNIEEPWPGNPTANPVSPLTAYPPSGFPDLAQLVYTTSGYNFNVPAQQQCVGSIVTTDNLGVFAGGQTLDSVGAPSNTYISTPPLPPQSNPGIDPTYGENGTCSGEGTGNPSGQCTWLEGDDQLCTNPIPPGAQPTASPWGWPYNGAMPIPDLPDGICEWTGPGVPTAAAVASSNAAQQIESFLPNGGNPPFTLQWNGANPPPTAYPPAPPLSSVDKLDDAMHTLSDFVNYSDIFLGQDLGLLSSTFDTWYPQMATWIAPACQQDPPENNMCNPRPIGSAVGQNGRLLSIYDPAGYPGVAGMSNSTSVDEFNDWNNMMTNWLNTTFTNGGGWCVPASNTLSSPTPNVEDLYISKYMFVMTPVWGNRPWGAMPSIIGCDDYNDGGVPVQAIAVVVAPAGLQQGGAVTTASSAGGNYQACLAALAAEKGLNCKVIPKQCAPQILGRDLAGGPPAFHPSGPVAPCPASNVSNCPSNATNCTASFPMLSTIPCSSSCPPNVCPGPGSIQTTTIVTSCQVCGSGGTVTYYCWGPGNTSFGACTTVPDNACPASDACTSSQPPCLDYICNSSSGGGTCSSCTNTSATNIYISGDCDPTFKNGYAGWVQQSLTDFGNEGPKFSLRAQYLTDIQNRAISLQKIAAQGEADLVQFLKPCSGADCSGGGPAAQLIYARSLPQPTAIQVPNSVIYGWLDQTKANGQKPGYAHIVKVTAYSPGRNINPTGAGASFVSSLLPWIQTSTGIFTRTYRLTDRDGYVYVSIKRWDEDHTNATTFPNGHPLWQFSFHNPTAPINSAPPIGNGTLGPCASLQPPGSPDTFGWGLEPLTALGLQMPYVGLSATDTVSLAQAFMLNDEGDGKIDPNVQNNSGKYNQCLLAADGLLVNAPESHACAEYIAGPNATRASQDDEHDYTLKFIDCNTIDKGNPPSDDLTGN